MTRPLLKTVPGPVAGHNCFLPCTFYPFPPDHQPSLEGVPVAVLYNKSDLPSAIPEERLQGMVRGIGSARVVKGCKYLGRSLTKWLKYTENKNPYSIPDRLRNFSDWRFNEELVWITNHFAEARQYRKHSQTYIGNVNARSLSLLPIASALATAPAAPVTDLVKILEPPSLY